MKRTPWTHICFLLMLFSLTRTLWSQSYVLEKLPEPINTRLYDEIGVLADSGEQAVIFTRIGMPDFNRTLFRDGIDVSAHLNESSYNSYLRQVYSEITGEYIQSPIEYSLNQDVFIGNLDEMTVQHPPYPLNSALPNSAIGISKNQKSLFLINRFYKSGSMYEGISRIDKASDNYLFPEPLHIKHFDLIGGDLNGHMTPDAEIIIFAFQGYDQDHKDLYISFFTGLKGHYKKLKPLGAPINTEFNESTPFLSQDKRFLYFVSDREGPDMDIYLSERLDFSYQNWSEPKKLGPEINSSANESHPYLDASSGNFYFCSDRDGSMDIFRYIQSFAPVPELHYVKGQVLDRETQNSIAAEVSHAPVSDPENREYYFTQTGAFEFEFMADGTHVFKALKAGYETANLILDSSGMKAEDKKWMLTIYMDKVVWDTSVTAEFKENNQKQEAQRQKDSTRITEANEQDDEKDILEPQAKPEFDLEEALLHNETVILDNIQFVHSQTVILKKSIPHLLELHKVLKENTSLHIEISGHTDNVGSKEALMDLSERRAEKIVKYLIARGIDPSRLQSRGFGDTRPLNRNLTEEEKRLNRRVEIKVLLK